MDSAPLVRERSRVQISPAAPFSTYDYRVLARRGEASVVAERRKNVRPYVARKWQGAWTQGADTVLYRYFDDDGFLLYVGITNQLDRRDEAHFFKTPWRLFARLLCVEAFPDRYTAETAESWAILAEDPIFNAKRQMLFGGSLWKHGDYLAACDGCLRGYASEAFILEDETGVYAPKMTRGPRGLVSVYEMQKAFYIEDGRPSNGFLCGLRPDKP